MATINDVGDKSTGAAHAGVRTVTFSQVPMPNGPIISTPPTSGQRWPRGEGVPRS